MPDRLNELEHRKSGVKQQLADIGDMRQGTLTERYLKCGKLGCRCAKEDDYKHGPHFSLTKGVNGKTVTRTIPKRAVESTKAQIKEFQEFRRLNQCLLEVSEEICDAKLVEGESGDTDQKKLSKKFSKLKSSEKSKS